MTDTLFNPTELVAILEELGENVRKGYVNKLVRNGHPTQENTLATTVTAEVSVDGTTYTVSLNLQDYWKYVEEGTRPHWPPRDAILRWVEIKPVIPRPDANGRIPTTEQLAFLISRKIAKKGTTGTHDLQETTDTLLGYYEERIAEALGRDTFAYIEKVLQTPTP